MVGARRWVSIGALALLVAWVAAPASAQVEYLDSITVLAGQVAELEDRAQTVNRAWEDGAATFDETLDGLRAIEQDTGAVVDALNTLVPPDEYAAQHNELQNQADLLLIAADAMVDGLRSNDSGEARQAALVEYTEAADAYLTISDAMLATDPGGGTTTTVEGETPETTQPGSPTTTSGEDATSTTVPGSTDTTTPTAQQPSDAEAGGTSTLVIVITLLIGIAIGLIAGLLIGAQIRKDLMRQVRDAQMGSSNVNASL